MFTEFCVDGGEGSVCCFSKKAGDDELHASRLSFELKKMKKNVPRMRLNKFDQQFECIYCMGRNCKLHFYYQNLQCLFMYLIGACIKNLFPKSDILFNGLFTERIQLLKWISSFFCEYYLNLGPSTLVEAL